MIQNRFTFSKFTYKDLFVEGESVLAGMTEVEGILERHAWMYDELETYDLLRQIEQHIANGATGRKINNNRAQFAAALNAIRAYKIRNGIPFQVKV